MYPACPFLGWYKTITITITIIVLLRPIVVFLSFSFFPFVFVFYSSLSPSIQNCGSIYFVVMAQNAIATSLLWSRQISRGSQTPPVTETLDKPVSLQPSGLPDQSYPFRRAWDSNTPHDLRKQPLGFAEHYILGL
ncbi:hypothetical protein F5B17DRAFT_306420 [Nemania serpens]|nr:hypothetical protein F5B17DRAFT_306420 [Nemania serpens]